MYSWPVNTVVGWLRRRNGKEKKVTQGVEVNVRFRGETCRRNETSAPGHVSPTGTDPGTRTYNSSQWITGPPDDFKVTVRNFDADDEYLYHLRSNYN